MYLGLDLGTSSLKALVINEAQKTMAEAVVSLDVSRPQDGWSEQDPASWIAACEKVFEQLAQQMSLEEIKGVGLSGHMHGATLLGAKDDVL